MSYITKYPSDLDKNNNGQGVGGEITQGSHIVFFISIVAFALIGCIFLLKSPRVNSPKEIHVEEGILTTQMNPSVLFDAIEEKASSWCKIKRTIPIFGDIVLSQADEDKDGVWDDVFMADSTAAVMARTYPHLFEFDDEDMKFSMKAGRNYVIVPVWLIERLLQRNVLEIPSDEDEN